MLNKYNQIPEKKQYISIYWNLLKTFSKFIDLTTVIRYAFYNKLVLHHEVISIIKLVLLINFSS